ncbi:hypothetical protein Tco_0318523 [Tanacetum coccineum]
MITVLTLYSTYAIQFCFDVFIIQSMKKSSAGLINKVYVDSLDFEHKFRLIYCFIILPPSWSLAIYEDCGHVSGSGTIQKKKETIVVGVEEEIEKQLQS